MFGPFTPGDKVVVFWSQDYAFFIGIVQKQEGNIVFIEDEEPALPVQIGIALCLPANDPSVADLVEQYEEHQEAMAVLEKKILEILREKL